MAAFDLDFEDIVPSDDWELNVLLLEIAKQLDENEFQKVKFLCTGEHKTKIQLCVAFRFVNMALETTSFVFTLYL